MGNVDRKPKTKKSQMKALTWRDLGFFKFSAFGGMPLWGWIFLAAMLGCAVWGITDR